MSRHADDADDEDGGGVAHGRGGLPGDDTDTADTADSADTIDTTAQATTAPSVAPATQPTTADTVAPTTAPETTAPETTAPQLSGEQREAIDAVLDASPRGCDPLDVRHCFLPYPSNALTRPDPDSATGLRVALPAAQAPTSSDGVTRDVTEWNRSDGFSPNAPIITHVPGLDDTTTELPPWTDLTASLEPDAPVVLVDAMTGERVALWAELDAKAPRAGDQTLLIRPAVALPEGHTFVVGLRDLRDRDGELIEPNAVFAAYRDGLRTDIARVERRREEMEQASPHSMPPESSEPACSSPGRSRRSAPATSPAASCTSATRRWPSSASRRRRSP